MTQDFRQPGPSQDPSQPKLQGPAANAQNVVFNSLKLSAVVFAVAGLWLLTMPQSLFPPELAPMLGGTFLLVALADLVAVGFLKRVWSTRK